MPEAPADCPFILDLPADGTVVRPHEGFDEYRPAGSDGPLPTVVFVPGPVPADQPHRPKDWPVYRGYGRLVAVAGLVAVVPSLPYYDMSDAGTATAWLREVVGRARALPGVDADRIAVWAFSAGALLVGGLLAESPPWLRCLGLTYPVLRGGGRTVAAEPTVARLPVVLTRVGLERADRQASVREFLDGAELAGIDVRVIEVPNGERGFDMDEPTESARAAVRTAIDAVAAHLAG